MLSVRPSFNQPFYFLFVLLLLIRLSLLTIHNNSQIYRLQKIIFITQLAMYQTVGRGRPRQLHYNLFQFEERMSNKFACNISRNYQEETTQHQLEQQRRRRNQYMNANIFQNNQKSLYTMDLILGELQVVVYQEGYGDYIPKGHYVQFRKRLYYQLDQKEVERDFFTWHYMYPDSASDREPIDLILSIAKVKFKARIYLGDQMAKKMNKSHIQNKALVMQIFVISVADHPLNNKFVELQKYHVQIMKLSIEGDHAFQNREIQKSLQFYQKALQMIYSEYYTNTLAYHKKQIPKQYSKVLNYLEYPQKTQKWKQQQQKLRQERQILELIDEYSQKIAIKGLQVTFITKQYIKAIRWANLILINPKFEKNLRVLLIRARSYLEMTQFNRALTDLKLAKLMQPNQQLIENQIQIAQKKKKEYQIAFNQFERNRLKTKSNNI